MAQTDASYDELFHAAASQASAEYDKSFEELQEEDLKSAKAAQKEVDDAKRRKQEELMQTKVDPLVRSDRGPDDDQATLENLSDDLAMAYADEAVEKAGPPEEP